MVLALAVALTIALFVAAYFAMKYREILLAVRNSDGKMAETEARARLEIARISNESRVREQVLVDKLVELSGRPPVIVDTSKAIREIGEAISRITQGPPEAVVENVKLRQEVAEQFARAMDSAGDPGGGVHFVPFADSDPFMDPEAARQAGQERTPVHVANGKMDPSTNLSTGRPVEFRSGEGGQPPVGGMEV